MYDQVCKDDLNIALLFFTSFLEDNRGIVIQCSRVSDIPYIKYNIRKVLGVPDRTINNTMYYERRPIKIVAISDESVFRGMCEDTLFFVEVYPSSVFTHIDESCIPRLLGDILKGAGLYQGEIAEVLGSSGVSKHHIAECISSCLA